MRPQLKQSGFTLVELLLAVTLLSLLLALAYGGLRAASRSSERGQVMLAESSQLRITHQFIRKQLNLMLPLAYEVEDGEENERYVFEGRPERIQFVGPMPGYLGNGGPHVQVMELVPGDDGLVLQFSHSQLQDFEPERLYDRPPVVLLSLVEDGFFEFLEPLPEEPGQTQWVQDWADPTQMPLAVRFELDLPETSSVAWPSLVASLRLDPESVIPGGGAPEDYAKRIQDMIKNTPGRKRE